jgi:hypothetical protein
MGLNVRIIKISDEFILKGEQRGFPHKGSKYRFILTEGYPDKLKFDNQHLLINFCPFCGKKLQKLYSKDEFVNETNHVW